MKLEIDTINKTILVKEEVKIEELITFIQASFKDWSEWKVSTESKTTIFPWDRTAPNIEFPIIRFVTPHYYDTGTPNTLPWTITY